ncbi:ornithine cyclodeaminase family protein [Brevibacterium sp. FAM 24638]|uniref:ornithine cyclodeaminase family protein n=1 Tax=Brevibacterium sp. FAM 24638 TaxID=3415681 RepID=UPI003C7DB545
MTSYATLPHLTANQVFDHLSIRDAVVGLEQVLKDGLAPREAHKRSSVPLEHGSFLLMPSEHGEYAGVKIASVTPDNPEHGLPKIQASFLLFNSSTLAPIAILDGTALTSIRTPAVSALGLNELAPPDASTVLVFGTGPQAYHHVRATAAVRPVTRVEVVGRTPDKARRLVDDLNAADVTASVGSGDSVPKADIILCCTSAHEPLFDGSKVREDAVVVAMGSHEPDVRETDDALISRSTVYVEDVQTALREAGDIVIAIRNQALCGEDLRELPELVRLGAEDRTGPAFFKTVGMGWEDLVVAQLAYEAYMR